MGRTASLTLYSVVFGACCIGYCTWFTHNVAVFYSVFFYFVIINFGICGDAVQFRLTFISLEIVQKQKVIGGWDIHEMLSLYPTPIHISRNCHHWRHQAFVVRRGTYLLGSDISYLNVVFFTTSNIEFKKEISRKNITIILIAIVICLVNKKENLSLSFPLWIEDIKLLEFQ